MQVAAQAGEAGVAAVGQFHLQQVDRLGLGLELRGHVVVEDPHATLTFDPPECVELRRQLARVQGPLRRQAALLAGELGLAQLAEVALEQVAVDQRVLVVERQRQPAARRRELVQHRQYGLGLGQPFQYRMADHQIEGRVELAEQFLPGGLDEGGRLAGAGEARAGPFEHRRGRLGQGHQVTAAGQPQRHMAEAGADIQHPQRAVRQGLGQVGLEHGEADRALGAAVDLLGEARGQLVEVAVLHGAKRRSLSASLARTACSRSMPSSLHSKSR